jgi:hypothetical protein
MRREQKDRDQLVPKDAPHLRIVSPELDTRAKKHRKATAKHYLAHAARGRRL